MMRVPTPVRIRVQGDQLKREVRITNSPIRLGSGGSAIFAKLEKNHQVAIKGRAIWRPRAKSMVRL